MDLNIDAAVAREDGRPRPVAGGEASPVAIAPAPAGERPLRAREAARSLASWRHKRDQAREQHQTRASTEAGAAPLEPVRNSSAPNGSLQDTGERPGLDPAQAPTSEIEGADRERVLSAEASAEAELPPIGPPRSWTKEDKELFTSLPRATQERIAERERLRESDFSRRQQQATEQAKALETERKHAEQTRQHYEAALPALLAQLQQPGEFSDINTVQDLEQLAATDPFRFGRWQVQQMHIATVAQELQATQQRLENEQWNRFVEYAKQQDQLLEEKLPELADKAKAAKVQDAALELLKGQGFSEKELIDSYNGKLGLHLRDHRLQLIVHDAMQWRDAQAKAKAASTAQVPPVQRPGVSQPRGAVHEAQIQNLTKRLETSGSLTDAAALLRARRASARR